MFRRALMLFVFPLSGLVAQATPLYITITATNNAQFRVVRSMDSASRTVFGQGRMLITDSGSVVGASETLIVIATDSLSRVHVEASEHDRVVASGDGAFVTIRRDTSSVFIEARSRAPAGEMRKP
jgi:hypothetical protein